MKSETQREPLIKVTGNLITSKDAALNARIAVAFKGDESKLLAWMKDYLSRRG